MSLNNELPTTQRINQVWALSSCLLVLRHQGKSTSYDHARSHGLFADIGHSRDRNAVQLGRILLPRSDLHDFRRVCQVTGNGGERVRQPSQRRLLHESI